IVKKRSVVLPLSLVRISLSLVRISNRPFLVVYPAHLVPSVHCSPFSPCLSLVNSVVSVGGFPAATTDYPVGRTAPSRRRPILNVPHEHICLSNIYNRNICANLIYAMWTYFGVFRKFSGLRAPGAEH